jgi:hypothetical protein
VRVGVDVDLQLIAGILDGLADGFIPISVDLRDAIQQAARILVEIGPDNPIEAICPNCGWVPGDTLVGHWRPERRGTVEFTGFRIVSRYAPGCPEWRFGYRKLWACNVCGPREER